MMAMLAIGAWATTVDLAYTGSTTINMTGENDAALVGLDASAWSVVGNKAGNNLYPGLNKDGSIRLYFHEDGNSIITVSSLNNLTINSISIEFSGANYSNAFVEVGGEQVTATDGTYEIGATSFVVGNANTSSGQVRINKITIDYTDGETPVVTVAAPTFSPAAGEVEAGTEVTISAPDAEMIVYTVDGTDPSYANNNGEIYTDPIVVNEAMTIKAIAVDADDNESSVASAAYTIKPEAVSVATVAEIKALADGTEFTFTGSLVVSGHAHATSGTNNWLFAQDETGGIQLFKAPQDYQKNDVIPAGFTATKQTYGGAAQLQNVADMQAATETQALVAEELTPAQVTVGNVFKYAVIKGATIDNNKIVVGEENVAIYNNRFNVTIPADGGVYDVYGITSYYNNPQFMPLEFVAQDVDVATPVISGETPFTESTLVTITCEEEGVSIHYTLDGSDPTINSTVYTAPFELTETTTVKAIAFNEAEDCSAIATMVFEKEEAPITCATVAEVLALEDEAPFTFTGNLVVIAQSAKYLYAQDETGGVLLFGTAPTYTKGQVIPSGFEAVFEADYKGAPEIKNMANMAAATETAELTPAEMTPAQVTVDPYNLFHYAVIKGASIVEGSIVVGEESVAIYNRFGVNAPTDDKIYDVIGVPGWYNVAQFMPLEFVEHVEPVTGYDEFYLVGTFNDWSQETGMIAFTGNEAGDEFVATVELEADALFKVITPIEDGWKWFGGLDENNVGYFLITDAISEVGLVDGANFKIEDGGEYTFTIKGMELAPEEKAVNEPLVMTVSKVQTGISTINAGNVKAVRYYNLQGVESATPFQGVNIVVSEMNDGTKNVAKMVK